MEHNEASGVGGMHKGIGVTLVAVALAACESGFTEADIEQAKKSIRAEYQKRPGVKVVDVQLIKESSKKLTGFVKITIGGSTVIMYDCTATWGETGQYIWRCQ